MSAEWALSRKDKATRGESARAKCRLFVQAKGTRIMALRLRSLQQT